MLVTDKLTVIGLILFVTRCLCSSYCSVGSLPLFEISWFNRSNLCVVNYDQLQVDRCTVTAIFVFVQPVDSHDVEN